MTAAEAPVVVVEVVPVLPEPDIPNPPEISAPGFDPDLWLYRERTVSILKRYMRLSGEIGRLPSILGREFFRARITVYHIFTFEDAVIFVHDVERSLRQLDDFARNLISVMVLQEHTQHSAARRLGCGRRTVARYFPEALDRLSGLFLAGGLLRRLPQTELRPEKSCQEGKTDEISVSDCNCSE